LLAGVVLLGAAVALALRALVMPASGTAARLEQLDAYGFHAVAHGGPSEAGEPGIRALAAAVGGFVIARSKRLSEANIRADLMKAGLYEMQPSTYVGYRVACVLLLAGAFVLAAPAVGAGGTLIVFGGVLSAVAGFFIPKALLERRTRLRWEEIDYTLPELIDLLVVTVEAGLGFSGSVQIAAEHLEGPLAEELRLSLQEQSMGLSTNEALSAMLARCETASMRSFVRSVLQAEQLGVSLGQIMRNLAREMRLRRRQAAEERAHKAPVKLLFPLVFLIFPSIFIVVLYPALTNIAHAFGG
jgi:tight adherence protein C